MAIFMQRLLLYLSYLFHFSLSTPKIILPAAPGPGGVHLSTIALTDHSRLDPFAPEKTQRRIMFSIFNPSNCSETVLVPYMPPATAAFFDKSLAQYGIPKGTFESFHLQTCSTSSKKAYPLVFFSPGLGESRLLYTVLLHWISSLGFTVISIDHPYDADIVEFPDGTIIYGVDINNRKELRKDLSVRVADARFVLDALSSQSFPQSAPSEISSKHFNTAKVAFFGHSFGGATAAEALVMDPRFTAGSNLDGSVYGPATKDDDRKPFVIFARPGHNQSSDPTWEVFWQKLKGWKLQLEVNETAHGSYTDYPILVESLGIDPAQDPQIADLIGTINGKRLFSILRAYIGAFLGYTLEHEKSSLLHGPTKAFPEVLFRNSSNPCPSS